MVLGMSVAAFTDLHVALSLIGIATGLLMALGMVRKRLWPGVTAAFLVTTVLTSLTGFLFPFKGITPGIVFGILSLVALAIAIGARYGGHLAGRWRGAWVLSAMLALYLNFFVFLVQLFDKVPELRAMGSQQKEGLFAAAQLATLVAFILWTVRAWRRFKVAVPEAAKTV
jgi:hypothetical protein